MKHFIAYHNVDERGEYNYPEKLLFEANRRKIGFLNEAIDNTVWVIQGKKNGKEKDFMLCGAYIGESVEPKSSSLHEYKINGSQITDFNPRLLLNHLSWFPEFRNSQGNFGFGFNRISSESVISALSVLQSDYGITLSETLPLYDIDLLFSVSESEKRLVSHLKRERNRPIIEAKKTEVLNTKGNLSCEACGFDFSMSYGSFGEGFCEVHHLSPLSASDDSVTTTLADLAVLCSNCHRIIHRSDPMLSVAELSEVVRNCRL